jgi:nucleotide-binding universal stress UspA family protein
MASIARIIAPTDFSPAADCATRRAASLASELGSALHLVHVLPPREVIEQILPPLHHGGVDAFRERAQQALRERAQRLGARLSAPPTCELYHGRAHQAILDAAHSSGADLVVLGVQGEHEGALSTEAVGGTAIKVAQRCRVATLLVRREPHMHYGHVLGCVSGVPADTAVVDWASSISPADLIHIVSAYSVPYERRLAEWGASKSTIDVYATRERDARTQQVSELISRFGLPAARARLHIERGDPLETILRSAAQWEADLIVVGRRAWGDLFAAGLFGSVARQVVFRAPVDVMVVAPPEGAAA